MVHFGQMGEEKRYEVSAHARYNMSYHIVWIVKYRHEVLEDEQVKKKLTEVIFEIGRNYEMPVEELGTDGDHLHLFVKAYPNILPAKVVEIFKSWSARVLLSEFPQIRQGKMGAGLWGVGYYLATVGHGSFESAVKAYVRNQGKVEVKYDQLKLV